ncbi:hypothetical protein AB9T88_11105, partial [Flavobacterium sp. LBUM151]
TIDSDGDGFYDGCDTCPGTFNPNQEPCNAIPCSVSNQEELTYENRLKSVFEYYISVKDSEGNASGVISQNTAIKDYVTDCNLVQHFQALRTNLNQNNPYSVNFSTYNISYSGASTRIEFHDDADPSHFFSYSSVGLDFDLRNAKKINYVDIIGQDITVNFTDNQNNIITQTDLLFSHLSTTYICPNGLCASLPGIPFCLFVSERYPERTNIVGKNSSKLIMYEELITYNGIDYTISNSSLTSKSSTAKSSFIETTESTCTGPCIPQTVEPVSCEEKYITYQNSGSISYLEQIDKNEFCTSNLQYLIDDYIKYNTALRIRSVGSYNYISIRDFGNTDLHYGYKNMDAAIAAYVAYDSANASNEDRLFWKEYINTIYAPGITECPPALMPFYSIPVPAPEHTPCEELAASVKATYQTDSYNKYIASLRQDFIDQYTEKAMNSVIENFNMNYSDKEYQYTLYYYDQAGNLTKTVAPEGVKRLSATDNAAALTLNQSINNFRNSPGTLENPALLPEHSFKTEYKYNSLNQLVWQQTPDGGITRFAYDKLGRIIASQNAKQIDATIEPGLQRFSYTNYDYLGRIIEAGEIHVPNALYKINDEGKLFVGNNAAEKFDDTYTKTEVSKTVYTEDPQVDETAKASSLFTTNTALDFNAADNNRNRVTGIYYYNTYNQTTPLTFDNAIFYNYDVHGNVKELLSYNAYLKSLGCNSGTVIDAVSGQTNWFGTKDWNG